MGVNLIKTNDGYNSSNHCEFQVASQSDIQNIPECAVGSIAYKQDLSTVWVYGEDHVWHKV